MNPFIPLSIPLDPAPAPVSDGPALSAVQSNSGEGTTVTFCNGVATVTSNAGSSMNVAELRNGHAGILGSATSPSGTPIGASSITATSLVVCDGMQTTAANAERLGYLVKNAATGLYEPGPEAKASEQAAAEKARVMRGEAADKSPERAPQGAALEAFDANSEANYRHISEATMPLTQATAIREWTTTGDVSGATINRLASEMGVQPEEMTQRIDHMRTAFMTQAHAAFRQLGASPEAITEWANTEAGWNVVSPAMREHITTRSTRAYAGVVASYYATLAQRDPNGALAVKFADGATSRRVGKDVLVYVPSLGTEVGFGQAIRQGLAKPVAR